MDQNYLAHYGIRGMKWGVRRTLAQLGRALKGSPGKGSVVKKPDGPPKPKPKSLSEMSDSELRAKLDRINMERQYKQYMAELNPKKESMIKRVALKMLENGLTTMADNAVKSVAGNVFKKSESDNPIALKDKDLSKLGPKEAASLVTYAENLRKIKAYLDKVD